MTAHTVAKHRVKGERSSTPRRVGKQQQNFRVILAGFVVGRCQWQATDDDNVYACVSVLSDVRSTACLNDMLDGRLFFIYTFYVQVAMHCAPFAPVCHTVAGHLGITRLYTALQFDGQGRVPLPSMAVQRRTTWRVEMTTRKG